MHILYQWIGGRKPENQGKLQRVRKQIPAHDGAAGALCMLLGLGKIIFGALSLSVFTCINGCYTPGDDGGKILCPGGNRAF